LQSGGWKPPELKPPLLIINCKNYRAAWGEGGLRLASVAEDVGRRFNVTVAVAPAAPFLKYISGGTRLPILSQHVDTVGEGAATGFLAPSSLKEAGCVGSLLNHSEHKLSARQVATAISLLRQEGLVAVVCAEDVSEARRLARLRPDFLAIEPPELIGTGVSVSKARPEVITATINEVKAFSPQTRVLCGAGVSDGADVEAALKLGSDGVLVSSGIVLAKDWRRAIEDMVGPMRAFYRGA
jgi:triosephosphate isomerase